MMPPVPQALNRAAVIEAVRVELDKHGLLDQLRVMMAFRSRTHVAA